MANSMESGQLIGAPLLLPSEERQVSTADVERTKELDAICIDNFRYGSEPYVIQVADVFKASWQQHLMDDGLEYAEAALRAAHYGVAQYEHLMRARLTDTLATANMSPTDYVSYIEQVTLAQVEVARRNHG